MMLRPLHRKKLITKLKNLGFIGPFVGGKHEHLINGNGFKVIIPNVHSGKDIPVPIIKAICKQIGISTETFTKL